MMIEPLETTVSVDMKSVPGGVVQATHRAHGHTHQPWNDPPLVSYNVLGFINADGKFVAFAGGDDTLSIRNTEGHADYDACLDDKGYLHGQLVIAAHAAIRAREAAAKAAAEAEAAALAAESVDASKQ